ncbi:sensor histidine kinase [Modestobacter sp. VKM Ac-2983]|uniref:sensor histidine kinase n=1 Tax=Modestobacter sp. VKM Ac-2983 TaxID=3004137 RepID=UPI0022AB8F65|nr:sensor histidine kinase [Modestobacter sp. VKM Ac-2983]MCZ2804880.1 sensor histidine kinase [Modestobacter sp. VKM Ac-2983]
MAGARDRTRGAAGPSPPGTVVRWAVLGWAGLVASTAASAPLTWREWPTTTVLTVLVAVALTVTGQFLLDRPRARRTGAPLVAVGALWPTSVWGVVDHGPGPFLSWTLSGVAWALLGIAMLSYPSDLPWTRGVRVYIAVLVTVLVPVNVAQALVSEPEWNGFAAGAWWPTLLSSPAWHWTTIAVYSTGCLALAAGAISLFLQRMRAASGIDRAALLPALLGVSTGAIVGAVTTSGQVLVASRQAWAAMVAIQSVALLALPISVALTALRTRLANADVVNTVGQLVRPATPDAVQHAVRTLLHDPSATVLFWSPERSGYIDGDGLPAGSATDHHRMNVEVRAASGDRLALVALDPRLGHHSGLVDWTVTSIGLALENAWLQAQLRAQLGEVRASRTRILDAQLSERRRLGRNLHDGAQQNLLALSMRLEAARTRTADQTTQRELTEIKDQLRTALADIRDLARGLHPAVLTQAGLGAAVAEMVGRRPVPVLVDLPAQRLDELVESAAYFVISEAIANADKHAGAGTVSIWGKVVDGDFVLRISDDGQGGADVDGAGLRGLADRVSALGGSLVVVSPPDGGTRVDVRLPSP